MRTRLSICRKKARYATKQDALSAASRAPFPLHPYRCDRCHQMHLTSRTKGRRIARPPQPGVTQPSGDIDRAAE